MDYRAAQKRVRYYRSRLTRLRNLRDHRAVIELWNAMQIEFDRQEWPLPDCWHRWQIASDDAALALRLSQHTQLRSWGL